MAIGYESINGIVSALRKVLLEACGMYFKNERERTLVSAVQRRMKSCGLECATAYYALLTRESAELRNLVELLTVNETYFFREADYLRMLVETVLPEMLLESPGRQLRILSAGCSTGEEPYSIAMLLYERFGDAAARLFSVSGVDIDSAAIATARKGRYGKSSFRCNDCSIRQCYFEACGQEEFQLSKNIMEHVVFDVVNLLSSPYPPAMRSPDIIFYRNVSIYFPEKVQREIFRRLAELLPEGGYLFVGATETLHHDVGILSLQQRNGLFYYRKGRPAGAVLQPRIVTAGTDQEAKPSASGLMLSPTVASPVVNRALSSSEVKSPALFAEALEIAQSNRHEEALELLDRILKNDQTFVKAHALKASILFDCSRFKEAGIVCNTLISLDQLCKDGYLMLGLIARQTGNHSDAARRLREAIYLDASCGLSHFYSAELLFDQGDRKRAVNAYETAARILEITVSGHRQPGLFPLNYNPGQFVTICRHKISLLKGNG